MRIYSMTATFGKLENQTISLEPGLNVIHAPNEWGKSTWCAFLLAMLYGLDTRSKSTKSALADKEHYAPWSGHPMSGKIDLCWNGRDITIERSTKGRTPMGFFRAYETKSGLDVPELTSANCGQRLLGVESSVYRRAGFIRQSDLAVTPDDALKKRLQELVATGEEGGEYAQLEKGLRELKNKCQYNKSGLLPQAQNELSQIRQRISDAQQFSTQQALLTEKLEKNRTRQWELENHLNTLYYTQVQEAETALAQAQSALKAREAVCAELPGEAECRQWFSELSDYQEQLSPMGKKQNHTLCDNDFQSISISEAEEDEAAYQQAKKRSLLLPSLAILAAIAGAVGIGLTQWAAAGIAFACSSLFLAAYIIAKQKKQRIRKDLEAKYGTEDSQQWHQIAAKQAELEAQRGKIRQRFHIDFDYHSITAERNTQLLAIQAWEQLESARQEVLRCRKQAQMAAAMAGNCQKPTQPDKLTYPIHQTQQLLSDLRMEQQHLVNQLGQYRGRLESLGDIGQLHQEQARLEARIHKLNDMYAALTLAQEAYALAAAQMQRRFAPKITGRAQTYLAELTDGRYNRLMFGEDFALRAGTMEETTVHDALWRSEGTIDQLYLSLRLAVAQELMPEAPLVLDDALVRFDDTRMKAAMVLLGQLSSKKQVILFSCQEREQAALGGK